MHMHLWCAEGMDWTPNLCPFGLEDSHCDLTPDSSVTKWAAVTVRRDYTPWASWFFLQHAGQTGQRKLGPLGRPLPSPGEVLRAGCQGPCHRQWGGLASLTCRQKPRAGRGSGWGRETCGPGGAGSEDGVEGNPGGRGCASPVKDSVVLETGPLLVVGGPPCAGGSQGLCHSASQPYAELEAGAEGLPSLHMDIARPFFLGTLHANRLELGSVTITLHVSVGSL